jgi:hypothetical protein
MNPRISALLAIAAFAVAGVLGSTETLAQNAYITNNQSNYMSVINTPLTSWQRAEHCCSARSSDIDRFGYGKCVVNFDTEVAHRALDLLMP